MRYIKVVIDGIPFVAETHIDAPQNVAAFTALLPYR
jgi:hypothetical protein